MTLQEISKDIENKLGQKLIQLQEAHTRLLEERLEANEEYKAANTGDRSENAPLEAAIEKMKKVNSKILENDKAIRLISGIDDLSRYNSVGVVVLYSTVRLTCRGSEYIYRIYPAGISYIDINIMAANSRLAVALMGKKEGDTVQLTHEGEGSTLIYKIEEIY